MHNQAKRQEFTDVLKIRRIVPTLGKHQGGCGIICDHTGQWSEQWYELGSVKSHTDNHGRKTWTLYRSEPSAADKREYDRLNAEYRGEDLASIMGDIS